MRPSLSGRGGYVTILTTNYMLNVGPDPLGRFPAAAVDILNGLSN